MNCQEAQDLLFELDQLSNVPSDVHQHLSACGSCTEMHGELMHLERQVTRLPIPPAKDKTGFVTDFVNQTIEPTILRLVSSSSPIHRKQRALQKLAGALAIASAVVLLLLGWWISRFLRKPPTTTPQNQVVEQKLPSRLARRLSQDDRWENAKDPLSRLQVLRSLSDTVLEEVDTHIRHITPRSREELTVKAALFDDLVREGILKQAEQLEPAKRRAVLQPLIKQLAETESEAKRMAAMSPEMAKPLDKIASTAHYGGEKLRRLIRVA